MFLALAMVGILLPLGAAYVERGAKVLIAERHHRHHDTYTVPSELTNSLVKAMVVMGGVGVVLGVLCLTGIFWQRYVFVLAFFDAFVISLFTAWLALCRHQVALFEDHMVVTPPLGSEVLVRYSDVDRLSWTGPRHGTGYRNLRVGVGGAYVATLLGVMDIEQITLHLDRFDAIEYGADGTLV